MLAVNVTSVCFWWKKCATRISSVKWVCLWLLKILSAPIQLLLLLISSVPTVPQKSWFLRTETSGPEKYWNWTLVLKKCWYLIAKNQAYLYISVAVHHLGPYETNYAVKLITFATICHPFCCMGPVKHFWEHLSIKFIGRSLKWCKSRCWLFGISGREFSLWNFSGNPVYQQQYV